MIYLTYFNAGVRIFDIKNPRAPKEVGWFMPPTPIKRHGPLPYDKLVSQTEDVLVDTRGNIYITEQLAGWTAWLSVTKSKPDLAERTIEISCRALPVFMNADQSGTLF